MIRVMVVDDSALVRRIATDILSADPGITVTATAATAEFALLKLAREKPDVITLDIEMPGMGGLEAIRRIMAVQPTPIVVMSAFAREGAELTLQALEAGAVDFVPKPSASLSGGIPAIARELVEKVKDAARVVVARRQAAAAGAPVPPLSPVSSVSIAAAEPARPDTRDTSALRGDEACEIVAIGTSTGGPVALRTVLEGLPRDFPAAILVVQHMPPVFTKAFADRLDTCCAVSVKEASDGDLVLPGRVLIAPGNWHMTVSRAGADRRVFLSQEETVNGHRPSVDVLLKSVAREYGPRAVGVIMTGMGRDGAEGMHELRARGGRVIAQDEATSVIYGMNREVVQNGDASDVAPVGEIAARLADCVRVGAAGRRAP